MFWWKSFYILVWKRKQKGWRVSNLALLLVVFKLHHGSEGVNKLNLRCKFELHEKMISVFAGFYQNRTSVSECVAGQIVASSIISPTTPSRYVYVWVWMWAGGWVCYDVGGLVWCGVVSVCVCVCDCVHVGSGVCVYLCLYQCMYCACDFTQLLWSFPQVGWNLFLNLLEGADSISGQLCRDKKCHFSGRTNSGRIWRRVLESDAQSVVMMLTDRFFVFLQEVFRVRREFQCCTGCFCCPCEGCRYYASVEDRNGTILGHVSNL